MKWNSDGGTVRVEQGSGTLMVEQSGWNTGTVQHSGWNTEVEQ